MDRLTMRDTDGTIGVGHPIRYYNNEDIVQVLNRLADYEDTGLTPEEIQEAVDLFKDWRDADIPKELKSWVERCTWHVRKCEELRRELDKYKKAEAEGRLLMLSCKVGDTVYIPRHKSLVDIDGIVINSKDLYYQWVKYDDGDYLLSELYGEFSSTAIGKTVFLSREEAEAALWGGRAE